MSADGEEELLVLAQLDSTTVVFKPKLRGDRQRGKDDVISLVNYC